MLKVAGKDVEFIVDSGATHSVVRAFEMPHAKLSGRCVYSVGASGAQVKEHFTVPLSCQPPQTPPEPPSSSIKHSFLLSNCCPLNLLGRDLMIVFGIHLKSTPDGVVVTSTEPHQYSLLQTDPPLIYVYVVG